MALNLSAIFAPLPEMSPLVLADRLIGLAQDADRAGYQETASQLVALVYAVLEDGCVRVPPFMAAVAGRRAGARL